MALNLEVDAISPGDIKTVTKEILVATADITSATDEFTADATGVDAPTNPANNTNPKIDNGWIVPGTVKVYTKTATSIVLQDYTIGANNVRTRTPGTLAYVSDPTGNTQDASKGTINYTTGAITLDYEANLTTADEIYVDYRHFTVQRRYTAGAVPTTLQYRNYKDTALIVIAESYDGTNWLQVGAHEVKPWGTYNLDRVTQRQLKVCSTSAGRLVGSPLSAI